MAKWENDTLVINAPAAKKPPWQSDPLENRTYTPPGTDIFDQPPESRESYMMAPEDLKR